MGAKITFDASNREFVCVGPPVNGVISINIREDLYSDGKEDWQSGSFPALQGMNFPIDAKGGDPFGSLILGDSYLITDGWTIRPYEGNHTLRLDGNIGTDDGRPLIEDTVGVYNVKAEYQISAIVEIREGLSAVDVNAKLDAIETYFIKVDARDEGSHGTFASGADAGKLVIRNTTVSRRWEAPVWADEAGTVPYAGTGLPFVGEMTEVAWS